MKKIIILLAILIVVLSGCAINQVKDEDDIDTIVSGDEISNTSGEVIKTEELNDEIEIEGIDEYLERKKINKEDAYYDYDEIFAEYYDPESEKELIELIKNDPYMKNLKGIKIEIEFYEGMPCQIITAKHESSLGYSIKYRPEVFKVKSENGKDVFHIENDNDISVTIEKHETSYDDMIASLNSYEVSEEGTIYTVKTDGIFVGNFEQCNYIKANNGFYIIKSIYPYTTEYIEGIGTTIDYMIESFEIK